MSKDEYVRVGAKRYGPLRSISHEHPHDASQSCCYASKKLGRSPSVRSKERERQMLRFASKWLSKRSVSQAARAALPMMTALGAGGVAGVVGCQTQNSGLLLGVAARGGTHLSIHTLP